MILIKLLVAGLLAFLANSAHADPVSAVIAVATMVGSAGAIAATATGILAGISFAGAAVSLIGNVTGNKKLMKIGAIASAGAGLASLASSALNAGATTMSGVSAADAAKETFRAAELADTANVTAAAEGASGASMAGAEAAANAGRNVAQNGTAATGSPSAPATVAAGETAAAPAITETTAPVTKGSTFGDAAKRAGSFIRDNKELVNLGGGLVKGAMEYKSVRDKYGDARGLAEDERKWLDARRQAYSDSVRAAAATPMPTVNDVNINQVAPQDPTKRYMPVRGLVNQAAQG